MSVYVYASAKRMGSDKKCECVSLVCMLGMLVQSLYKSECDMRCKCHAISETFHMKTAPQGDCSGRPSHSVSMTKALMLLYRTSSQVSPEIVPSHHLYTLVFLLQLAENTQVRL